jgi:stage V sporulation protein R
MSDWSVSDLEKWDDRIKSCAESFNLDWFPIIYEICDYYDMMGYMAYHGMPSHYSHWSYGKTFERTRQLYNQGMEGLPYELIINSNPSIAYLMRENPIYLQIVIMAHCIGHSDFFKNNRIFSKTRPEHTVMKFKSARDRIKSYIEDPSIGIENVEKVLDAAHTIRFQTERNGFDRIPHDDLVQKEIDKINSESKTALALDDIEKIPIKKDNDLLGFMIEHGDHFKDWERDILEIVRDESQYFIPQIKTKILNEGWASFWHYKLLHELELDSGLHLPFIKTHNQVIRPHIGAINPYHLGFHIFKKIEKNSGLDECFFVREVHDDEQALRRFIEREDCEELNLFSYSSKKSKVTIDEVSDEDGWKVVKNDLIRNTGVGGIPEISVVETSKYGEIILEHEHDGRDLELDYADKVLNQIRYLWPKGAKLFTIIEDELWEMD